jgi:hypothetical protein
VCLTSYALMRAMFQPIGGFKPCAVSVQRLRHENLPNTMKTVRLKGRDPVCVMWEQGIKRAKVAPPAPSPGPEGSSQHSIVAAFKALGNPNGTSAGTKTGSGAAWLPIRPVTPKGSPTTIDQDVLEVAPPFIARYGCHSCLASPCTHACKT